MKSSRRAASERRLCVRCELMFDSPAELKEHLTSRHKDRPPKEKERPVVRSKTPSCSDAPRKGKEKKQEDEEKKKNKKKKRGRKQMDYKNGFGLPTGGSYVEEPHSERGDEPSAEKSAWKPFVCLSCPFRTRHVSSLRAHIAARHKAWSFSCSECDARFALGTALRQHERSAHPDVLTLRLQEEAEEELHRCEECGAAFESRRAMKLHARRHKADTKVRETFCEICRRNFFSTYSFNRHQKVVHEKSVPKEMFLCKVCGRQCATKYTLRAHEAQHGNERFACREEGCLSSFSSADALSLHRRRTHSQRRYSCSSCNLAFRYHSVLQQHTRAKHSSNIVAFKCPTCAKVLRHPASRRRHMRAHLRPKDRRCDVCSFTCHEASSLKRHKWLKHQQPKLQEKKEPKSAEKSKQSSVPAVPAVTSSLSPFSPPQSHQIPPQSHQTPPQRHQTPPQNHQSPQIHQAPPQSHQAPPQNHQSPQIHQAPENHQSSQIHQAPPQNQQSPQIHTTPPQSHQAPLQSHQAPSPLPAVLPHPRPFLSPPAAPPQPSEAPVSPLCPPPPSATPLPSLDFLTDLQAPLLEPDPEACPLPSRSAPPGELLVFNCETNAMELIQMSRLHFDGQKVVLLPLGPTQTLDNSPSA